MAAIVIRATVRSATKGQYTCSWGWKSVSKGALNCNGLGRGGGWSGMKVEMECLI